MLFHFLRHFFPQTGALFLIGAPLLSGCVSHQAVDLTGTDCPCSGNWVCDTATDTCMREGAVPGTGRDAGGTDSSTDSGGGTDSGTDAPGDSGTDTPMDMGVDTPPAGGGTVWIEAESGALTAPMMASDDVDASGGMYIVVPPVLSSTDAAPADGNAVFTFNVTEEGNHRIWGRVHAPDTETDSFWVGVDANTPVAWNGLPTPPYAWVLVSDFDGVTQVYDLSPGEHTITVSYRQAGAQLDKLVVTNDMSLTPTGMGE